MAKKSSKSQVPARVKNFLKDSKTLFEIPINKKHIQLNVAEAPFDLHLLTASPLYRQSRKLYFALGGQFKPTVCSTMRGLSAQDLFNDEIEYTPAMSEFTWINDFGHHVSDVDDEIKSLLRFTEISLFHEQNHRVLWRLLPPAPEDQDDIRRYLNFAESLVVTLDMALGDQLGRKLSTTFENMKIIYHSGGSDKYYEKSKAEYRNYLLAIVATTYYALETLHNDDILNAVNYVLPGQKKTNQVAVKRGLQLSEIFTRVTNPQWQSLYWKIGQQKLSVLQKNSTQDTLYIPIDPLDLEEEFVIAKRIFEQFGL